MQNTLSQKLPCLIDGVQSSTVTVIIFGSIRTTQRRSQTAAANITAKANMTAPSRIITKRSGLILATQLRSTTAAPPINPKANTTAPSWIMTKRSGLILATRLRSTTAAYCGNGRTICNAHWRISRSSPNWPRLIRMVPRQLSASQRR